MIMKAAWSVNFTFILKHPELFDNLLDFLLAACFFAAAFFLYLTPDPSCWLTTA